MTNIDAIDAQIGNVKKYLQATGNFKKYSKEEIVDNQERAFSCERALYLTTQSAIDLAESVISYKSFRKPTELKESFEILYENGVIETDLMHKLCDMVGFRNALAHGYDKFDYDILYDVLQNGLKDIEEFVEEVKKAL